MTGSTPEVPRHGWGVAVVRGRSMLPTLRDGDRLLVRWGAAPRPGRIAVVRWPGTPLSVKRLLRPDGTGWWAERDNPAEGVDSWQRGAVAAGEVLAVAVARLWPRPGRLPGPPHPPQPPAPADAPARPG